MEKNKFPNKSHLPWLYAWITKYGGEVEEMCISLIKLKCRLEFNPQTQGQKTEVTSQPPN